MATDPLSQLLKADSARTEAAREVAQAMSALTDAVTAYRAAWKKATSHGWARTDLTRAGLIDPQRLPRGLGRSGQETPEVEGE